MALVTLITGSNLGQIEENIKNVVPFIEERIGKVIKSSSIHISEPWGFDSPNNFANQVLVCETMLSPFDVLEQALAIEKLFGRVREEKTDGKRNYSSRMMDIDILFYDDLILETELLTIPQKLIEARKFVLNPLSEVYGELIHPTIGKSVNELLKELEGRG